MKGGFTTRYRVALSTLRRHRQRAVHAAHHQGFTIVEVMIVLAVTGALFASAAAMIAGRQNRTQFTLAINNVESQIQQAVSDVGSGFYPSTNSINCSLNAATGAPQFSVGTNKQGANAPCTFMGKAVQFGVKDTDPEQFAVYALAGLRQKTDGSDVQTIAEANPKVMTLNNSDPTGLPTTILTLQNGLQTGKMTYTHAGITKDIVAVAFVSDLTQNSNGLVSGAQNVNVYPIVSPIGQTTPTTPADTASAINAQLKTSQVNPDGGVNICFLSNTTDQAGIVTIGGANQRPNAVTLTIRSSRTCP